MRMRLWLCGVVVLAIAASVEAADWPQWRGPDHTDVTPESSGWPDGWPPRELWRASVGKGCTSPIIADGKLYTMGWHGSGGRRAKTGTDTVYCFDAATGRELWKQSYPCRYQSRLRTGDTGAYGGPSATPTFDADTGWLYTVSIDGDLKCWDAAAGGKPVWSVNFFDRYTIRQRPDVGKGRRDYGFPGSPLVWGDLVIVEVGAAEGTIVAFDKQTGAERWRSEYNRPAGHSGGPVPCQIAGRDCLVSLALQNVVVMRADKGHEGRTLAAWKWQTDFANNIPTPAVAGTRIVVTSDYNVSRTACFEITARGVQERWQTREHSKVSSPVIHKGQVFIADKSLKCLDLATGETRWKGGSFGHGSCLVTAADEKLLAFGNGRLVLVDASPSVREYRELGRAEKLVGGTCYPHVALSDGIVACKDRSGDLVCLSVRDKRSAGASGARPRRGASGAPRVYAAATPERPSARPETSWGGAAMPVAALTKGGRARVKVGAAGVARLELPVEVAVRVPPGAGAPHVFETDPARPRARVAVPHQFDADPDEPGHGILVIWLRGEMPAGNARQFLIEPGAPSRRRSAPTDELVRLTDGVDHEGQESYRLQTPAATWYYHKAGAGFASLEDHDGRDWIGFHPKGGSDGRYRGIPNLVHPEGYFHPGGTKCTSRIVHRGPVRVRIASESADGKWACHWDVFPALARLTVTRADHAYWFLYEGTPGGELDEATDFCVRSDGTRTPASKRWTGDLPDPEWLYFGDPVRNRILFLAQEADDRLVDSYWPMQGNMTVFGFGRKGLGKFLKATPARFIVGLAEGTEPQRGKLVVESATRPLEVEVTPAE